MNHKLWLKKLKKRNVLIISYIKYKFIEIQKLILILTCDGTAIHKLDLICNLKDILTSHYNFSRLEKSQLLRRVDE